MAFVGYRSGQVYGVWTVSPPDDLVVELADDHPDIEAFRAQQAARLSTGDKFASLDARLKAVEDKVK